MAADLTPEVLLAWVDRYEQVWRSDAPAGRLGELFTPDVTYLTEPYADPVTGLAALEEWWRGESAPGEVFSMAREVVACSGRTGVVRVVVEYEQPVRQEYTDLWVVTMDAAGLAERFEEWPFWPTHGRSPSRG